MILPPPPFSDLEYYNTQHNTNKISIHVNFSKDRDLCDDLKNVNTCLADSCNRTWSSITIAFKKEVMITLCNFKWKLNSLQCRILQGSALFNILQNSPRFSMYILCTKKSVNFLREIESMLESFQKKTFYWDD